MSLIPISNIAGYIYKSNGDGWTLTTVQTYKDEIDGLVQERHYSSTLAMELCLSCTNPSNENYIYA